LLQYVSLNKVFRLYSPSFDAKPEKIDPTLEKISNFREREVCDCKKRSCPVENSADNFSYEEVYTARVIISTTIASSRLVSGGIKSNHFDYIFIGNIIL
jgi:hypothetical protein